MMNQIPISGKLCTVEVSAGSKIEFTSGWNISILQIPIDKTVFGQNWRTMAIGLKGYTGSFLGQFIPGNTQMKYVMDALLNLTELTSIKFTIDSTSNYFAPDTTNFPAASILLAGFNTSPNVNGTVTYTFTFMGNGPIAMNGS
jgi:hypothetical protein